MLKQLTDFKIRWLIFAAICILIYSFPIYYNYLANFDSEVAIIKPFKSNELTHILLITRNREAMNFNEQDKFPYRPSTITGFHRQNGSWTLFGHSLPIRSESTTLYKPSLQDMPTVRYFIQHDGYYVYGDQSVRDGIYWANWRVDQFARHQYALALSDEKQLDNRITLKTTETIVSFTRVSTNLSKKSLVLEDSTTSSRGHKLNCFIHESTNIGWNHRDSEGCLNLLAIPRAGELVSDWEQFKHWFDSYNAVSDGPILVIISYRNNVNVLDTISGKLGKEIVDKLTSALKNGV